MPRKPALPAGGRRDLALGNLILRRDSTCLLRACHAGCGRRGASFSLRAPCPVVLSLPSLPWEPARRCAPPSSALPTPAAKWLSSAGLTFLSFFAAPARSPALFFLFPRGALQFPRSVWTEVQRHYHYGVGTVASTVCHIIPSLFWVNLAKKKILEGNWLCHL